MLFSPLNMLIWPPTSRWAPAVLASIITTLPLASMGATLRAPDQLPDRTAAYLRIENTAELVEQLQETSVGRALRDERVRPLVGELWGSLGDNLAQFEAQAGVGIDQLFASVPGELVAALVGVPQSPPALVIMFQADSDHPLMETLAQGEDRLREAGFRAERDAIDGVDVRILSGGEGPFQEIIQLELAPWRVITTDREVAAEMIALRAGTIDTSLANSGSFRAVISRCDPNGTAAIRWYADPIGLIRAMYQGNFAVSTGLAMLPALGVDGLQAIGGSIALAQDTYDTIIQMHILMEPPRDGVLEAIALGQGSTDPEPWVPAETADYTTWHIQVEDGYDTIKDLLDSFRGEGSTKRLIDRRVSERLGADFEEELLPALAGRISRVILYEQPASATSQATAISIELHDAAAFLPTLDKITMKWDDRIEHFRYAGVSCYQWRGREAGGEDARTDDDAELSPRARRRREARQRRFQARPVLTILGNSLVITDRRDLAERFIRTYQSAEPRLRDELEFKLVASRLRKLARGSSSTLRFQRPDKGLEMLYQLLQTEDVRKQLHERREQHPFFAKLDDLIKEKQMPPFPVLAQYFAPSGSTIVNEETGIHYTGFSLRRSLDD